MSALKFWKPTNHRDVYSRATSWHSRKSITWLWSLWYEWGTSELRTMQPQPWWFWHSYRTNQGLQWDLKIGEMRLHWHKQKSMSRRSSGSMAAICLLILLSSTAMAQMQPILTRSADNARSGDYQDATFTVANVKALGIVRATTIPVIGDARGMEAQPLILPNVKVADGSIHDVMVLPSMANVVRGIDAATGVGLWQANLGMPINGSAAIDFHLINQHWGCLSTGVIDAADGRLYQTCWVSPDGTGSPQTARYYMFVLRVADGSLYVPPVLIQGSDGSNNFNAAMRKARSSAVLINQNGTRTVLQCTGTVQETGTGADGFCFAFDTYTNNITAMIATTSGEGGGIWMGGQGLSCDAAGECYAITGNGDFDGVTQWGESFIHLHYVPPTATTAASLKIVGGWSPWTDRMRSGQDQVPSGKLAGVSMASEAVKPVGSSMNMPMTNAKLVATVNAQNQPTVLVYPAMASGNWSDEDWGSAGPACIFQIGVCIATGKDGIGYPIPVPSLGGGSITADFANPKANCAKLAAPPVWLTMSPGNVDPCPMDPKTLNFFPNGLTAHLHATPVQYYVPATNQWYLFVWGENAQLHKWAVSSTGTLSYVAEGTIYASADIRGNSPGGMVGAECAMSTNNWKPGTSVLWCSVPYGDANATVTNGRFVVYDPDTLELLWDSSAWGISYLYNKFDPMIVDGGHVFLPNYNGGVDVYTLTPTNELTALIK